MRAFAFLHFTCLLLLVMKCPSTTKGQERNDPDKMTVKELKKELSELGVACKACSEKSDFIEKLKEARKSANNKFPFCAPKKSCREGCEICSLPSSQSESICIAISFCEWNRPTTPRLEGSHKDRQRVRGDRSKDRTTQEKYKKKTETRPPQPSRSKPPRDAGKVKREREEPTRRNGYGDERPPPSRANSDRIQNDFSTGSSLSLFQVASSGDAVAVRSAIERGLSVSVTDARGATPLHYASWYGHVSTVEVLLSANAPINAVSGDGFTPLHLAAAFGHASVVRVLLNAGADRNRLDRDGNSAYELARRGSHSGVMQLLSGSNLMNNNDRGNNERQVSNFIAALTELSVCQVCTVAYAKLGLCAPDEQTKSLVEAEERETAAREEMLRMEEDRRRAYTGDDGSYRQRAGHERGEDKRHRGPILVNRDMQAEVGMRVRKSKERLEFVQQNGWEDLSEGRAGSIVSLLGDGRQCLVRWDNGNENEYAIGYGDLYDLILDSEK